MISEDYLALMLEDNFGPLCAIPVDHHRPAQLGGALVGGGAVLPLEQSPRIPPCHARSRRADPVFAHDVASRTGGFARW
ncbi:hypothetical protein QH494_16065 [Sphingomonas sp. AR_OL41]|uniref:hypothetical protein n=1 Tax=Sphingomonas sp. AR_OL41 TaxID=3042729 RepID=UPI002480538E|nr:hypothetical protein [Sphingomonas sp. AR_OL41]MDH7973708.1 hypothetical protein [Sphingomonas sp. AR_OL41]